jgi:hypothetical protein
MAEGRQIAMVLFAQSLQLPQGSVDLGSFHGLLLFRLLKVSAPIIAKVHPKRKGERQFFDTGSEWKNQTEQPISLAQDCT